MTIETWGEGRDDYTQTVSGDHLYIESGAIVSISGQHVFVESGVHVITQLGIQVSGTVAVSGTVMAAAAGTIRVDSIPILTADSGGQMIATISGPTHYMVVRGLSGNDDIFVGGITSRPYSGYGFLLQGNNDVTLNVKNTGLVYACANISGQRVTYIATDY